MKYDLRSPCKSCPFRSDIRRFLHPDRYSDLDFDATVRGAFICHMTIAHDDDGELIGDPAREQMCAGAMIYAETLGQPGQMLRIAERFNLYHHERLDMMSPVYRSREALLGLEGIGMKISHENPDGGVVDLDRGDTVRRRGSVTKKRPGFWQLGRRD